MSKQNIPKDTKVNQVAGVSPVTDTKAHSLKTNVPAVKTATVLTLPGACMCEQCKKKSEKAGFCMEHFDWFKEGLITKEGKKPSDFEKKFFNYQQRRRPAA